MNKIISLLILATLFSCKENQDVFSDTDFGKVSKKKFVKEMIDNKTFSFFQDNPENPKDTTAIMYEFIHDGKHFPTRLHFNEEFRTDRYNFGKLRKVELQVGEDSKEYGIVYHSGGKVKKEFLDGLYDAFTNMYGKPDSLDVLTEYKYSSPFGEYSKSAHKIIDKSYFQGKKAIWLKDNFKLTCYIPTLKKPTTDVAYYQKPSDKRIRIVYEMNEYENEFKRIQDSIAKTFVPDDLVYLTTGKCEWSNKRLTIPLYQLIRRDLEEPRRIKGIRFDLAITDSFKKELFRADGLTLQLPEGSYLESRPQKGAYGQAMVADINRAFYADFKYPNYYKLTNLEKYSRSNKIKIETPIKSILFEDGSILNAN